MHNRTWGPAFAVALGIAVACQASPPAPATPVGPPATSAPAAAPPAAPAPAPTATPVPPTPTPLPPMTLTSEAFQHEGQIPQRYGQRTFQDRPGVTMRCPGENVVTPLKWANVPPRAQSLALIVEDRLDPNNPRAVFTHWLVYNIPPTATGLAPTAPADPTLPDGSLQGMNNYGQVGYGGPCPGPETHTYIYTLYALDRRLDLPPQANRQAFLDAIQGRILAQVELRGFYVGSR